MRLRATFRRARAGLSFAGRQYLNGPWAIPLRLATTVVLLGLVFVRNDLSSVPDQMGRVNVPLLVAMLGCSYVAWIVNTYRWQRIMASFRLRHGFVELFRLNLAGVFYGLALPGQISGEVLKALRIVGPTNQRRAVYGSIFLDRVYGLIGLALLGCVALIFAPPQVEWVGSSPSIALLIAVMLGCIAVVCFPWLSTLRQSPSRRSAGAYGRFSTSLLGLTTAEGVAPSASILAVGCALGLASQALTAAIHWGVAMALGISISPLALTWIMALGTIVGMFPISLAGLGLREATYVGLLALYGLSAASALALSLTMFMILLALGLTGGALDLLAPRRR